MGNSEDIEFENFFNNMKHKQKFLYKGTCYTFNDVNWELTGPGGIKYFLGDVIKDSDSDWKDWIKLLPQPTTKENKMAKTVTSTVTTALTQVTDTAKNDIKDGAWRAGTNEAIEIVCEQALKVAEKHTNEFVFEYCKLALNSVAGKAALAMVVGNGILVSNHPNKSFQRLGRELRVYGWANTFSWAFRVLVRPIMDELLELVKGLPEENSSEDTQ